MRFIIHELPYERPIAAGKLVYQQDGRPTGAVESWRLSDAVDGYRFLRVDLDAQQAPSGQSTLYHLTLNPSGQPVQLKYRFWKPGLAASGMVLWEDKSLLLEQRANDEVHEETIEPLDEAGFWFSTTLGLAFLLWSTGPAQATTAVLLRPELTPDDEQPLLSSTCVTISKGEAETISTMNQELAAERFTIIWADQQRTIWLDPHKRPLQMQRDDGLTAVATRLIEYLNTDETDEANKRG